MWHWWHSGFATSEREILLTKRRLKTDGGWCKTPPEAHEQESPNEEANENDDESGETPEKPEDDDHDMQGTCLRSLT